MKKYKLIYFGLVSSTLLLGISNVQNTFAETNLSDHVKSDSKLVEIDNIDEWMPNKNTQQALLQGLIDAGYLPYQSTVKNITKEFIGSIPAAHIDPLTQVPVGEIPIEIDGSVDDAINKDTFTGLEYIKKATLYTTVSLNENQFYQIDWKDYPSNGATEYGPRSMLGFSFQNKDGKISGDIFNEVNNFAIDPQGVHKSGTLQYAVSANGDAVKTLNLSNNDYKTWIIKDTDFAKGAMPKLGNPNIDLYLYDKNTNQRQFIPIYKIKHNDALFQWEGNADESYDIMWNTIKSDPQRYSVVVQYEESNNLMMGLGSQRFDFK